MNETIMFEAFQQAQSNPIIGFKIALALVLVQSLFFFLITIFAKEHGKRLIKIGSIWIIWLLSILIADLIFSFIVAPYLF